MMAGTYNQRYLGYDSDSDTDFGCGWSPGSQKKAASNWRDIYKDRRNEYTGSVTDLLKSALEQIRGKGVDPSTEWLILPSTHEYFRFHESMKPSTLEGRTFTKLIPDSNGGNNKRFKELEKSKCVFTISMNEISLLTESDPEGLLPSVVKIIEISEKNLNGSGFCTIS